MKFPSQQLVDLGFSYRQIGEALLYNHTSQRTLSKIDIIEQIIESLLGIVNLNFENSN